MIIITQMVVEIGDIEQTSPRVRGERSAPCASRARWVDVLASIDAAARSNPLIFLRAIRVRSVPCWWLARVPHDSIDTGCRCTLMSSIEVVGSINYFLVTHRKRLHRSAVVW